MNKIATVKGVRQSNVGLLGLGTRLGWVKPTHAHTVSRGLTTCLIGRPCVNLSMITIRSSTFVLSRRAQLTVQHQSRDQPRTQCHQMRIVTNTVRLNVKPRLRNRHLAVSRHVRTRYGPLDGYHHLLTTPRFIHSKGPITLNTGHAGRTGLSVISNVGNFGLTNLRRTLTLPFRVITRQMPQRLTRKGLLTGPNHQLTRAVRNGTHGRPVQ